MRRTNQERSATTRTGVLDAARKLFAGQGYAATSLGQVAAEAGVTTGAVYHHWANKEDLFAAVIEHVHTDLHDALGARTGSAQHPPLVRLKATGSAFLRRCADPAVGRILLVDGPAVLGQQRWQDIDERWWRRPTVALLHEAARIPAAHREEIAVALLGGLTALGQQISRDPRPARVRRCQQAFRTLVDALSAADGDAPDRR